MSRAAISNWYTTLTPRDQRVLQIGAVVVVLILLVGIFLPLQRKVNAADRKLVTQQQDLDWMRQVAPRLAAAGPAPAAAASKESLAVLVDTSARESGLGKTLTSSEQTSNGALKVQFENANFNALTGWLSRLSSQHAVHIETATLTAGKNPGIVNASIQMSAR